ncbi:MAG: GNAT family protein [Pseudomonadota bacterium]
MALVPFVPEHFATLSSWFLSTTDVVQWGGPSLSFPLMDKQLTAMLANANEDPPGQLSWMVEYDGALIGHAQLRFDWRNGSALLRRVALAPLARERRLANPMLRLLIAEGFARPEIQRIELNVYTWNIAAIRSYTRVGFKAEGIRRSSAQVGTERWDTAIMGLLRHEWSVDTP